MHILGFPTRILEDAAGLLWDVGNIHHEDLVRAVSAGTSCSITKYKYVTENITIYILV